MTEIDFEKGKKDLEKIEKLTSYIQHLEKKIKNYEVEVSILRNGVTKAE